MHPPLLRRPPPPRCITGPTGGAARCPSPYDPTSAQSAPPLRPSWRPATAALYVIVAIVVLVLLQAGGVCRGMHAACVLRRNQRRHPGGHGMHPTNRQEGARRVFGNPVCVALGGSSSLQPTSRANGCALLSRPPNSQAHARHHRRTRAPVCPPPTRSPRPPPPPGPSCLQPKPPNPQTIRHSPASLPPAPAPCTYLLVQLEELVRHLTTPRSSIDVVSVATPTGGQEARGGRGGWMGG